MGVGKAPLPAALAAAGLSSSIDDDSRRPTTDPDLISAMCSSPSLLQTESLRQAAVRNACNRLGAFNPPSSRPLPCCSTASYMVPFALDAICQSYLSERADLAIVL